MPALILINGTVMHAVTVLDIAPWSGKYTEKRLLIQWNGAGQCQYVLNLKSNTIHKTTTNGRLGSKAGMWKIRKEDLEFAMETWLEMYNRKMR